MLAKCKTSFMDYFGLDAMPGFYGRAALDSRDFVAELLGLRGVGICMVVIGHLMQRIDRFETVDSFNSMYDFYFFLFSNPFAGCGILFCVNGYTLRYSIARTGNSSMSRTMTTHFIRRLIRLGIPYFTVLASTFLFLAVSGYQPVGTHQFYTQPTSLTLSFLASLTFMHDILFSTFPRLFPPGWFLEVLVQFYIIGPIILIMFLKMSSKSNRIWLSFLVLLTFLFVTLINQQKGPHNTQYSFIAFMPYFWTGIILAELEIGDNENIVRCALRSWHHFGWAALILFFLFNLPFGNDFIRLPAQVICLFFIFSAARVDGASVQRTMVGRWLTRIGVASYSIFLVHLQILQVSVPLIFQHINLKDPATAILICSVLCVPIVILISLVFYWLIERPFTVAAKQISFAAPISSYSTQKI